MSKQITKTVYTLQELIDMKASGLEKAKQWLRDGVSTYNWHEYTIEMWQKALAQIGFDNPEISFRGFCSQGDGASFDATIDVGALAEFMASCTLSNFAIQPTKRTADMKTEDGQEEDFWPWLIWKFRGGKSQDEGHTELNELLPMNNPKFTKLAPIADNIDITIEQNSFATHYCHQRTRFIESSFNDEDKGEWIEPQDGERYGHWRTNLTRTAALVQEFAEAAESLRLELSNAIYRDLESEYEYLCSDEAILETAEANEYTFTEYGEREG